MPTSNPSPSDLHHPTFTIQPSPLLRRWWLRCHIFCSVLWTAVLIAAVFTESVSRVILSKICLLHNTISKSEVIQTVSITKSSYVIKTITDCTCAPLRHVYQHPRFTQLTCTTQGYTNWKFFVIPTMTEVAIVMCLS